MQNNDPRLIRYPIRLKFLLVTLAILLIVTASLSIFFYHNSEDAIREQILFDLKALLSSKIDHIEDIIHKDSDAVILIASRRYPREYLYKLSSNAPDVETFRQSTLDTLRDAKNSVSSIELIDVMSVDGRIASSTDPSRIGSIYQDLSLLAAGKDGGIHVGGIIAKDNAFFYDIAVPLYNPFEKGIIGCEIVRVRLSDLLNLVENYSHFGATGEMVLAKRSGDNISFIMPLRFNKEAHLNLNIPIDSRFAQAMSLALKGGEGSQELIDYRGKKVLAAYNHLSKGGVGAVIKIDADEAYAPIRTMLQRTMVFLIIFFILTLVVVYFFTRPIIRPIHELYKGVCIMASGDLTREVNVTSRDEIGQLAAGYNDMLRSLRKITASRDELNEEMRKRIFAEERLRAAFHELEKVQEELIQSGKMAAMGHLSAGISHELNQPLSVIKGLAQLILMELPDDSGIRPDIMKIIDQSNRMDAIIKNVRFFSRKADFQLRDIDLNAAIEDSLDIIGKQLEVSTIKVVKQFASDLPMIKGDKNQLSQVFLNLIINAKDAIEGSGAHITKKEIFIKTYFDVNKKQIEVTFSDSGCGISTENIHHIFDPFFTTKTPDKGMGMGLAIVYRVIENHKGKISVESKLGQGTTFKILFSVAR